MELCMKSRRIYNRIQGLLGGLFLLVGTAFMFMAFFAASTALAEMTPERMQQVHGIQPISGTIDNQSPRVRQQGPVRAGATSGTINHGGVATSRAAPMARSSVGPVPAPVGEGEQIEPVTVAPVNANMAPRRGAVSNVNQSRAAAIPLRQGSGGQAGAISPQARGAVPTGANVSRAAVTQPARGVAQRPGAQNQAVQVRAAVPGAVATHPGGQAGVPARAVSQNPRAMSAAAANNARGVTARSAASASATQARVSLTGPAMRSGIRLNPGHNIAQNNTFLSNQLHQQTFSNLIDPHTGMLASDVYSSCFQAYYACMDEICTVRRPGQRRCACAGRVRTFNDVEHQLIHARETLLRVSGEISLMILTRGESIHSAFELSDAEISLQCVSFRDMIRQSGGGTAQPTDELERARCGGLNVRDCWCRDRNAVGGTGNWDCTTEMNQMCDRYSQGSTNWMDILNGSDSSILAGLSQFAHQINHVDTMFSTDPNMFFGSIFNVNQIVNGGNANLFAGSSQEQEMDRLAQTWGYELFEFGHNNVCARVLDSCFNGVFERCGQRPAELGGGTGPFNLNSRIRVENNDVVFNVIGSGTANANNVGTPQCFGYTAATGDPFATLRRPIGEARLSILQRYVLDSNADCDVWGENLRSQLQNVDLQRVAAQQMLQRMRLEFAQERQQNTANALANAKQSFVRCIDEIHQCRNDQNHERSTRHGQTNAIISFCNLMSQVPSCYQPMICNQGAPVKVTEGADRNTVTLAEILSRNNLTNPEVPNALEMCLRNTLGIHTCDATNDNCTVPQGENSIRDWNATR